MHHAAVAEYLRRIGLDVSVEEFLRNELYVADCLAEQDEDVNADYIAELMAESKKNAEYARRIEAIAQEVRKLIVDHWSEEACDAEYRRSVVRWLMKDITDQVEEER